jgi:hypothetical protein
LVKHIALPKRQVITAGLLACALAATALYALTISYASAALSSMPERNVPQRPIGTATMSKKTLVNLDDLVASAGGRTADGRTVVDRGAAAAVIRSGSTSAPQLTVAAQVNAAAGAAPTVDVSFNGVGGATEPLSPPDPNAAAGLTQIVEVVNTTLRVYTRNGSPDTCGSTALTTFFGSGAGETVVDPRVIYDNVANKFTVIAMVNKRGPVGPLDIFPVIRVAHSLTGNACGTNVGDGNVVDQPSVGQDRNAFLFSGAEFTAAGAFVRFVALAESKSCAYSDDIPGNCSIPIFATAHYANPASAGGNPMISTGSSYFVATAKNVGYELYRMDNAASPAQTTLVRQATVGLATDVQALIRDAQQPFTASRIDLDAGSAVDSDTRLTSTPTFDGTRIWFTHNTWAANHPAVRYGAINTATNTESDALVVHSSSSDDFNPSIAVSLNGASRTIFLNWTYTDPPAGIPVTDTVAATTINNTDPLPPINGKDIKVSDGGITNDPRFGDYSSTMIDPLNFGQVCAVAAQQYFDKTSGRWATRITRFGAPGC